MAQDLLNQSLRTAWTVIRAGQGAAVDASVRRSCLEHLFTTYRGPVKAMVRAWGVAGEHQVEELVQEYFTVFLEKGWLDTLDQSRGSFRAFLRTSVRNFLLNEKKRAARRPNSVPIENPGESPSAQYAWVPAGGSAPGELFDRAWARSLMANAVDAFHSDCRAAGLTHYQEAFDRHVLRPEEHGNPSYRETAEALSATEKDVENYVRRARDKFLRVLCDLVRETVESGSEVEAELADLRRCFR